MNSSLNDRLKAIASLRDLISPDNKKLVAAIEYAKLKNPWFTIDNTWLALNGIANKFLDTQVLNDWVSNYTFNENPKNVGLILAGNLPLVGFHDVLSCFVAGHKSLIKFSDKDAVLLKYLVETFTEKHPEFKEQFEFIDRLQNYDAVIATGSNNSARYFEYYFGKKPNIIRKNRNGLAILDGKESDDELRELSRDVFSYFGLGCRNVSKIYIPENYKFEQLLGIFHEKKEIIMHNKYKNNFDYNISLYMLNRIEYSDNESIILKNDTVKASRIACLNYERYESIDTLESQLLNELEEIQCVATRLKLDRLKTVSLGQTQFPNIDDYADGVDTLSFLTNL